jgi:hypothetical protein
MPTLCDTTLASAAVSPIFPASTGGKLLGNGTKRRVRITLFSDKFLTTIKRRILQRHLEITGSPTAMPTREVLRFSHLGVARNNVLGKTSPPCNPFFLGEADGVSSTDPRVVLFSEELSAARGNPCPECVPCAELSLEEQSCCGKGSWSASGDGSCSRRHGMRVSMKRCV